MQGSFLRKKKTSQNLKVSSKREISLVFGRKIRRRRAGELRKGEEGSKSKSHTKKSQQAGRKKQTPSDSSNRGTL